jgi:polysaccharide biosynthesis protein PslG
VRRRTAAFLLVTLLAAAILVPRSSRADLPASPFGMNSHIATRFGNHGLLPYAADVVAATGAGWVREDFHWFFVEPTPGRYQWEFYDRAIGLLAARGVNIIGVLGHPPSWATAEPSDDPARLSFYAPDPQRFARFAAAAAARYRGVVVHWEIWNEPDNTHFWKPAPDPLAYARLISETYPAISAVAPEANVLLGGINPFETSFLRTLAEVGAWWAFDIINIHPYVGSGPPEANGGIAQGVENVRAIAAWAGEKPIWITEYGWDALPSPENPLGMSEEDQANYLVRGALLLQAAGAERVLWYALKDETVNGYGLLRFASGHDDLTSVRPAYSAFATLNRELAGARFERQLGEVTLLSGGPVYALRYRAGDETIDVVWALVPSEILLPVPGDGAEAANRYRDRWWVAAEAGALRLYPEPSPIYIRSLPRGS